MKNTSKYMKYISITPPTSKYFMMTNFDLGCDYLVKSVISIMIIHICLASTMMSLPLSSHLATSASSLHFSCLKLSTCSAIFAFSSWGSCAMMACRQQIKTVRGGRGNVGKFRKENCSFVSVITEEKKQREKTEVETLDKTGEKIVTQLTVRKQR